jgi:hypothetical protein
MTLPYSVAHQLQWQLRELSVDDSSCASFASGNIEDIPDNTVHRWQFGVDMIYRCFRSDLALVLYDQRKFGDINSFLVAIRTLTPFDRGGGMTWNANFLRGTDSLRNLIGKYFSDISQYDPNLNPAFVKELEEIFQRHDVAWSETPLLPILPK